MASRPTLLQYFALVYIAAAVSSFTIVSAEEFSKSKEHPETDSAVTSDSSSQEDSKEKRSQEEILFGNQQNKPSGLVDDLMEIADNAEEEDSDNSSILDKKASTSEANEQHLENAEKEDKDEKRTPENEGANDMMKSDEQNWYNTIPVSTSAMQYLSNSNALKAMPSEDFTNGLYDQEDLYRRKRELLGGRPLPLRKRSLRSSLGQMIQKRGVRMPRRSMRLKRQVNMDDLLNLFGSDRYYDDEAQITPHIFSGRSQTVAKRHVPGRFSGYPETAAPEYRYPYVFRHRDDGILNPTAENDEISEPMEGETLDDIDNLMLLPPNYRYAEVAYGSPNDEKENYQQWLARHTVPSVFRVSRRSAPVFYPIDYRYVPGYKKRSRSAPPRSTLHSRFSNSNLGPSDVEDSEGGEFGKWGHVVQVPEAYASPEDVARLYGLANLMAEGDEGGEKMRRSA